MLSVLVPAYNEEGTIGPVLDRLELLDLDCEIIVVNGVAQGLALLAQVLRARGVEQHRQVQPGQHRRRDHPALRLPHEPVDVRPRPGRLHGEGGPTVHVEEADRRAGAPRCRAGASS